MSALWTDVRGSPRLTTWLASWIHFVTSTITPVNIRKWPMRGWKPAATAILERPTQGDHPDQGCGLPDPATF
jgi:hypothetical protein